MCNAPLSGLSWRPDIYRSENLRQGAFSIHRHCYFLKSFLFMIWWIWKTCSWIVILLGQIWNHGTSLRMCSTLFNVSSRLFQCQRWHETSCLYIGTTELSNGDWQTSWDRITVWGDEKLRTAERFQSFQFVAFVGVEALGPAFAGLRTWTSVKTEATFDLTTNSSRSGKKQDLKKPDLLRPVLNTAPK